MSKLVVKETVTKEREIEVSIEDLLSLIDDLTLKEKEKLFNKLSTSLNTDFHRSNYSHNHSLILTIKSFMERA